MTCARGNHEAGGSAVRNQGLEFGRCRRCGRDLVRAGRSWRGVPHGFRVVWRSGPPEPREASAAQLPLDLPVAGRALALRPPRRPPIQVWFEIMLLALQALAAAFAVWLTAWVDTLHAPAGQPAQIFGLPAPE